MLVEKVLDCARRWVSRVDFGMKEEVSPFILLSPCRGNVAVDDRGNGAIKDRENITFLVAACKKALEAFPEEWFVITRVRAVRFGSVYHTVDGTFSNPG